MFNNLEIKYNEELKNHSTFKIGGYARFFILPKNFNETKQAILDCKKNKIKYLILGNGSNVLFDDTPFNGAVISMANLDTIKQRKYKENIYVTVGAGTNLFALNNFLQKKGIAGLEWSFGIPGTVGGATKVNAGAYGNNIGDFVKEVTILKKGNIIKTKKIKFDYRKSSLIDEVILSVKLKLIRGDPENIKIKMQSFLEKRKESQPYSLPSIGSIFKRKGNLIPSKIIDQLGLKGLRIGDAMISTKHAGFIVNVGSATSSEVKKLLKILEFILESKGYNFKKEIIIIEN